MRLAATVLGLVGLAGCATRSEGLVVDLQTDLVAGTEFDSVRVRLDGASQRVIDIDGSRSFEAPRRLTTYADSASGIRRVEVALLAGTRSVASRTVDIDVPGSRLVTMLITRSCAGVGCPPGASCFAGTCAPTSCVRGDEPTCPPLDCVGALDCAPDVAPCVTTDCVRGVCFAHPDHGLCTAGERCVPGQGCRAMSRDAGGDGATDVGPDRPDGGPPPDGGGLDAGLDAGGDAE